MQIAMSGAATGIGAAVLNRLKRAGHGVAAFDIREPQAADAWHPVDMAEPDAVRDAAEAATGPFDALILNAGLPPRADNAAELLAVNFLGLTTLAEAMLPKLAPGGAIVATASRAGEHWRDNLAEVKALLQIDDPAALPGFVSGRGIDPLRAYCLSKEAVIVWTMRMTARLLDMDLRVNCVSPSAVDTPILGDFIKALGERAERSLRRIGRAGTADEIAALIVFLADPQSGWIRGQNVTIDGGMTAIAATETLDL